MAPTTTHRITRLPTIPVGKVKHPRSFVIYGRSGTGKTTIAGSFPKPILYLDVNDRGTDSIADVDDIEVFEVECLEDFEDAYYYLKGGNHPYKTVVIDTFTELQAMVMKQVLEKKKKSTRNLGDWGSMTKQEYGATAGILKDWVTDFRNLDMTVAFLAQERADRAEEDDGDNMLLPEIGPRTMPSVASALNAAVSVIGNTFIRIKRVKKEVNGKKVTKERMVYCLRVGPNPVYATKIRKPRNVVAPDYIEDATYDDILDVIEGVE